MKAASDEGKPIASPDDTLAIALSLAAVGWPVFPVKLVPVTRADGSKAVDKRPLVKWLEGATTDPEQIATWWGADFPGSWIGVNAARAGIVVVDLDMSKPWAKGTPLAGQPKGDGRANLVAAGYKLPKTLNYPTRGGGAHYVYAAPEGKRLTIGRDEPVPGVDIRAGNGLMVYYGPKLDGAPFLSPAPSWSLIETTAKPTDSGGDPSVWRDRQHPGKPTKAVRQALKSVSNDINHDGMLEAVSALVKLGSQGHRGAGEAIDHARNVYIDRRPDRARDWDNAVEGSIRRHGAPPATLELTKPERQRIAERNKPAAIEKVDTDRKADYRVAVNEKARATPSAGVRILEDGPLAVELSEAMRGHWAWTKAMGLLRYTGKRWEEAEPHALIEEVRKRLDDIEVEEHEAAVRRGDNKALDKARTLLSRNRARAVGDLVIGRLALDAAKPDAHPHLLNTPSGVVDLRTKTLMPHDPELMLTKITAVGYDPDADMTLWSKALTALPAKVAAWVQVRLGQSVTGFTPDDDVLVLFQGGGENGKTTILSAPREALGEYAVTVPDRLLLANPGDHPTELTTLMGARMAVVEELPEGRNLNVKRLKDVVGTPVITARRMRADNISWRSTHCLFLSTNYMPIVAETDHGTWRRMLLVRFRDTFVKDVADIKGPRDRLGDPAIRRHFEQHADAGVLRWLVDGAHAWYRNGKAMPKPPKRVRTDTDDWRMDADPVLGYVAERIEPDETSAIACIDLFGDFNDYIERRGHRPWSAQTVNARLEGHVSMKGVERRKVRFGRITPSRPPFSIKPLPPNTQAWVGVRFVGDPVRIVSEAEADHERLADIGRGM